MENVWYKVHCFHQKVSSFLMNRPIVYLETLLSLGDELVKENIGNEKYSILFSLASVCEIVSDKRALSYWEQIISDNSNEEFFLRALLFEAMFYMKINDKEKGVAIAKQLLEESKNRCNDLYLLQTWEFFGKLYWQEEKYIQSVDAYSKMLLYAKKIGDENSQFRAYIKIGLSCEKVGKRGLALSYLLKANIIAQKLNHSTDIVLCEFFKGKIFADVGEYNRAKKANQKCENILENIF